MNLSGKSHVIPTKIRDSEQHVTPFEAVKVKLLTLKLVPHLHTNLEINKQANCKTNLRH